MKGSCRRFEILLPLRYNDGQSIPEDLLTEVIFELRAQFGGVSAETQTIRGLWQDQENEYRDEHVRVFVDVPDTAENREFFVQFKERLKKKLNQLEMWITTFPIEIL